MDTLLQIEKPLVSVNWLYQHKDATNLIVLDGTIPKVTQQKNKTNIEETQIPRARFFDIKKYFQFKELLFQTRH